MFDFRYHALSIVAVFLALLIGLLLGVAIGDRGLVSSAETSLRSSLRGEIRDAQAQSDDLRRQLTARERFESAALSPLIAGRLNGQRVGIIALGNLQSGTVNAVRNALDGTGGELVSVSVIREPMDRVALANAAANTRYDALAVDDTLLQPFGFRVGAQYVQGGKLLPRLRAALLGSGYSGQFDGLDAVVLERSDPDLKDDDAAALNAFQQGLLQGITSNDVPVVGIEKLSTEPSQVSWYNDRDLASVDDIDQVQGKAALVLALASRRKGAFGEKPTAEAPLPPGVGPAGQ